MDNRGHLKSTKKKNQLDSGPPADRPLVPLLDPQQVCSILRIHRRTLFRMNVDGRLKPFVLLSANAPRYHPADLWRLLEQCAPGTEQAAKARAERYAKTGGQFLSKAEKAARSAQAQSKGQMTSTSSIEASLVEAIHEPSAKGRPGKGEG